MLWIRIRKIITIYLEQELYSFTVTLVSDYGPWTDPINDTHSLHIFQWKKYNMTKKQKNKLHTVDLTYFGEEKPIDPEPQPEKSDVQNRYRYEPD